MANLGTCVKIVSLLTALICLSTGCLTTGTPLTAVDVHLSAGNQILQNGKPVQTEKLASRLKSLGATQATRIQVHLANDTSPATVEAIRQNLVLNGLPRIILITATRSVGSAAAPVRPTTPSATRKP